ncbi:MAG: response regulator [Planctomycetes bacterium]|nr:response regulator [Planctomycetota bacterium]
MTSVVEQHRVVAGRYRLLRTLGSGAHGTVDLAEDLLNGGRRVAVKRLEAIVGAGDPEPAAEVLRWFLHPRWAEVLDEGRLDAHGRFQVTRYVPGHSLDHVELPRPVDEVFRLLEDGARVLRAIHRCGLVHYDVTLGNWIREEGPEGVSFTLTDGGLASVGPVRGIARGSPAFMAPEVLEGAEHDHRADLFSLGLVAWRLATGGDPHGIGGAGEVLGRRRRSAAPRLRQVRPDVPEGLERVLAALLERDPQRRPADGDALLSLLAEAGWDGARTEMWAEEAAALAAGGRLVGRADALARFRNACRALLADGPATASPFDADPPQPTPTADTVLVVHGPSGVGGTRLLREMATVARGEGVAVLALSGREGAADRRSALRRVADALVALAGGPPSPSSAPDARDERDSLSDARATERFVELTERVAERTPFVLLVEDFAELPAATQEGFRVLSRHLLARAAHPDGRRPPRLLLVVDHGPDDPASLLIPDADRPTQPCVPLPPLTEAELGVVVADRLPGYEGPTSDLATLRAVSEGLPGVLVSLLAEGLRRGDVRRVDTRWIWVVDDVRGYRVPRAVSAAHHRALAAASPELRTALETLALFDEPVSIRFLEAVVGSAAASALAASLLVASSHERDTLRLAPASRALRAALRDLPPETLALRRKAVLETWDRAPAPDLVADVAHIAVAAGDADGAFRRLVAAAPALDATQRRRASTALGATVAARPALLGTAAARAQAATLLVAGVDSASLAGALSAAVLAAASPEDDLVRVLLAENAYSRHEHRRVVELTTPPLRSTDPLLVARRSVAELRARVALDATSLSRDDVVRLFSDVRRLAPSVRRAHPAVPVGAYLALTRYHFENADASLAEVVCRRALVRARRAHDLHLTLQAYNNLGIAQQRRDVRAADRSFARAVRIRLALGEARAAARSLHNLGRLRQARGLDVEAAGLYQKSLGIAVRHADYDAACIALQMLGDLYDAKGSLSLAISVHDRVLAMSQSIGHVRHALESAAAAAELSVAMGQRAAARDYLVVGARVSRRSSCTSREILLGALALVRYQLGDQRRTLQALGRVKIRRTAGLDGLCAIESIHRANARTGASEDHRDFGNLTDEQAHLRTSVVALYRGAKGAASGSETAVAQLLATLGDVVTARVGVHRRLLATRLVDLVRHQQNQRRPVTTALRTAVRVLAQARLRTAEERLRLVLAVESLRLGDRTSSAECLNAVLSGESPSGTSLELRRHRATWDPPEFAWALAELAVGGQSPVSETRTQLHAAAHRLALNSGITRAGDTRVVDALRTTLSLSAQLRTSSGLEALLETLTDCARRITRAERTCVVLVRPDGTGEVRVVSSAPGTSLGDRSRHVSQTIMKRVISTRQPLLLHDVYGDSELLGRPSVAALSLRSALCVPLTRGDRLFGAMYADSRAGAGSFDRVDLEVLSLFAEQASAAIETARLLADVQRSYAELKSTQERLVRGERLRVMGELASGVAHEFNNLLTAILARVQLLSLEPLPQRLRGELSLIQRTALDAAEVVRRLQGFSKSQRQSDFQRVDMGEVCADVVEFMRPMWIGRRNAGGGQISVVLRATRGLVVAGDPTELREVVTNLLKNAIEAIDGRGSVVVSASERGGRVVLCVEDDGPGVPAELRARLFTPFFTTKGEKGTGLGLCLSQQIVERHGGEISISPRVGGGTSAQVLLPVATSASSEASIPAEQTLQAARSLSVVVVDDDPNVLDPLCSFLRRSGVNARAAFSATEALEAVAAEQPKAVISDIGMPGMDGLELCRRLRSSNPELPVILMSGRATSADAARVEEVGAAALLAKPFTMRQVLDLLARYG